MPTQLNQLEQALNRIRTGSQSLRMVVITKRNPLLARLKTYSLCPYDEYFETFLTYMR